MAMAFGVFLVLCILLGHFFGSEKKKVRVKKEGIQLFSAARNAVTELHKANCKAEAADAR